MKVKEIVALLQEANQDKEVRMVDYMPLLAAVSFPDEGTPGEVVLSVKTNQELEYEEACLRG